MADNGVADYTKKLVESVTYLGIAGLGFALARGVLDAVLAILS